MSIASPDRSAPRGESGTTPTVLSAWSRCTVTSVTRSSRHRSILVPIRAQPGGGLLKPETQRSVIIGMRPTRTTAWPASTSTASSSTYNQPVRRSPAAPRSCARSGSSATGHRRRRRSTSGQRPVDQSERRLERCALQRLHDRYRRHANATGGQSPGADAESARRRRAPVCA